MLITMVKAVLICVVHVTINSDIIHAQPAAASYVCLDGKETIAPKVSQNVSYFSSI